MGLDVAIDNEFYSYVGWVILLTINITAKCQTTSIKEHELILAEVFESEADVE